MTTQSKDSAYGWLLVGAQFLLIAVLVAQLWRPVFNQSVATSILAVALFLSGLTLFGFTQYFNRPGNWSVHPHPKSGGQLITNGPYRLIRHPMYSAALLCSIGVALWVFNGAALICTIALAIVFVLKIRIEEREMATSFAEWNAFASRTRRLIPFIW